MGWNDAGSHWNSIMGREGNWYQFAYVHPYLDNILAPQPRPTRVLDAGCGTGHLCRFLADKGLQVTGVDISSEMIAQAQGYETPGVTYVASDINAFVPTEPYDLIVANNCLQDVVDLPATLRSMREMLTADGLMAVVIRHPCFYPMKSSLGWQLTSTSGGCFTSGQGLTGILESGEEVSGEFFMMDDYFVEASDDRHWQQYAAASFHRTLSTYFKAFISSGWEVIDVSEPLPAETAGTVNISSLTARIPIFIMLTARQRTIS